MQGILDQSMNEANALGGGSAEESKNNSSSGDGVAGVSA